MTSKPPSYDRADSASDTRSTKSLSASQLRDPSTNSSRTLSEHDSRYAPRGDGFPDDTSSDFSGHGPYEIIEYDIFEHEEMRGLNSMFDELDALDALRIEEDSPAAQALAANANVKVSTLGKAARAVHMQTVRKIVKQATGRTKSGVARGKPPRLPPGYDHNADCQSGRLDRIDESDEDAPYPTGPSPPSSAVAKESICEDQSLAETSESVIPDNVVKGTAEAGKKVLDQVDTHDLLKLLRWRRKRKGDYTTKKTKSYVKGKVIDGEHELYTLSIAVMIGVRTSISRTNTELNSGPGHRWVRPFDFSVAEKYEFRPRGGSMTPPHMLAHTFKFKDYAPIPFAYLRRMFGINEFDFLFSVCGNANFIEFISNAKSGQFFFYSSDGRYMIKTVTNAESKFLRRILPDYFKHCAENPNTMVTRFFGMYRVKLYHLRRNVKFVVMNSVYDTDKYLQRFFDLKGSVIGRDAKPGEAVKKDNDLRRGLPGSSIALKPEQRERVRSQIETDCSFLKRKEAMDYSMLVGVHHKPPSDNHRSSISTLGYRPRHSQNSRPDMEHNDSDSHDDNHDSQTSQPARRRSANDGGHRLSESIGAFFYENGLEEDDSSYLEGADDNRSFNMETERKKQATVEKLYWPFHRYFDIHGHRRMKPVTCVKCNVAPCSCNDEEERLKGYNIPTFIPPISDRKDKGFEMDVAGQKLPMKIRGPNGVELYGGKIFYMGIIDILQEYNSRKLLEATWKRITSSRLQASCVEPGEYCHRFVKFFDEYTKPLPPNYDDSLVTSDPPQFHWQRNSLNPRVEEPEIAEVKP